DRIRMQQPLFGAFDTLLHFNGASGRSVSLQRSNAHSRSRKIVVLDWRSSVPRQVPSTVAALIGGEICGKHVGFSIRRLAAANSRCGHVQIVIGATQRSRSLELTCVEPRCDLGPSLAGGLLIDRNTFCACGAYCESRGWLFVAGETSRLAEELG